MQLRRQPETGKLGRGVFTELPKSILNQRIHIPCADGHSGWHALYPDGYRIR